MRVHFVPDNGSIHFFFPGIDHFNRTPDFFGKKGAGRLVVQLLSGSESAAHSRLYNAHIIFRHGKKFRKDTTFLVRGLGIAPDVQMYSIRKIANTGCRFQSYMLHG